MRKKPELTEAEATMMVSRLGVVAQDVRGIVRRAKRHGNIDVSKKWLDAVMAITEVQDVVEALYMGTAGRDWDPAYRYPS